MLVHGVSSPSVADSQLAVCTLANILSGTTLPAAETEAAASRPAVMLSMVQAGALEHIEKRVKHAENLLTEMGLQTPESVDQQEHGLLLGAFSLAAELVAGSPDACESLIWKVQQQQQQQELQQNARAFQPCAILSLAFRLLHLPDHQQKASEVLLHLLQHSTVVSSGVQLEMVVWAGGCLATAIPCSSQGREAISLYQQQALQGTALALQIVPFEMACTSFPEEDSRYLR